MLIRRILYYASQTDEHGSAQLDESVDEVLPYEKRIKHARAIIKHELKNIDKTQGDLAMTLI